MSYKVKHVCSTTGVSKVWNVDIGDTLLYVRLEVRPVRVCLSGVAVTRVAPPRPSEETRRGSTLKTDDIKQRLKLLVVNTCIKY